MVLSRLGSLCAGSRLSPCGLPGNRRTHDSWPDGWRRTPRWNVYYPGLPSHPDHERSRRLFANGWVGGAVSFAIRGARQAEIFRFVNALELFLKATTVGDLQSLILYPAVSSHRDLAPRHRERLGITENLVRLSVGIEDVEDLQADLAQALARV